MFHTTAKGEFHSMGAAAAAAGEGGLWEGPGSEVMACDGGAKKVRGRKSRRPHSGMAVQPGGCFS